MPNSSETIVAAVEAAHAAGDLGLERAPDIIVALNARSPEAAAEILQHLSSEKAVEVLDQLRSIFAGCSQDPVRDHVGMCVYAQGRLLGSM